MLKVGVIGAGYLGRLHAKVYSSLEGVELCAVADIDRARAEEAAGVFGGEVFSDYRQMLSLVDAVSVVTPTDTHFEIAKECLGVGKDILLEKPMCSTVGQADELIERVRKTGRILQVGHIERYNPAAVRVFSLLNAPLFIEAERVSPFLERAAGVDVTVDLMIHDIDIALCALGFPEVAELRAVGASVVSKNLDAARAWVYFKNGTSVFLAAGRVSDEKRRRMRFFERGRIIELDFMARRIIIKTPGGEEVIEAGDKEPLREELADFARSVRERTTPRVSPREARDALELALNISQMARSGLNQ